MPPTPRESLQRLPRLCAEQLDLRGRARALYEDVTLRPEFRVEMDRLGLRERRNQVMRTDGRRGAEILATEIVEFIAAGATHGEIEQLLQWVRAIADDAFAARGDELPDLLTAEAAEASADTAEDQSQTLHLIARLRGEPTSDAQLEERIRTTRRQVAASAVLVRALESELRRRNLGLYARRAS